jgi:tetratricopeptide (TPR) repeat protein
MGGVGREVTTILLLTLLVGGCGPELAEDDESAPDEAVASAAGGLSPLDRGEELYRSGEFRSAIEQFTTASDSAQMLGDSAEVAVATTWVGLAYYQLGEYGPALEYGSAALEMKRRLGMVDELPRSLNALGLLAWQEGRLGDALDLHERSRSAAVVVGDEVGVARSLNNLALVQTDLGNLASAEAWYVEAASAFRDLEIVDYEGRALTNLGALRMEVGDPVGAEDALARAFDLYAEDADPVGELNALGQLGVVRAAQGNPEAGLESLTAALEQARAMELAWEEASNLEQLANIHVDLGSSRLALDLYQQANALNQELGLPYEQGANLRAQAGVQRAEGNLTMAAEQLEQALSLHRGIGARAEELWDVLHLAELAQEAGDPGAADRWLAEADTIATRLAHPRADIDLALTRAAIAEAREDPASVLASVELLTPMLERAPLDVRWRLALHDAQARADLDDVGALAAAREAAALVDRLRRAIGSDVLRNGVTQARSETYHLLVDLLLKRGEVGAAFVATDASRSSAALRQLASSGGERDTTTHRTVDDLLERVGQLDAALASRYRSLFGDDSDAFVLREMAELEERRASVLDELADVGVRFAVDDEPETAPLPAPLDFGELQADLADDEAVLTWLETEDALIGFAVRRDTVVARRETISSEALASRVRVARALISDPTRFEDEGVAVMSALHETLFGGMTQPGGVLADATRLVLVTDGSLTYLPFAAVLDPTSGRYLIERYTLSSIPSAAALLALRQRDRTTPSPGPEDWVGAGFAPTPEELPRTVNEVDDFVARVPGRAFLGQEATEVEIRRALEAGAVVHAAAHGRMNARNPLFTSLQLAPGSGESDDDGLLHVHELLQISSRSPLVFLSACETGLASAWAPGVLGGRDLSTLAQALLYGGTGSVVATLWTVEDQAAARFSSWFYDALEVGRPAAALASAQRRMLASESAAAPFYWAGYMVLGPESAMPFPR